MRPITKLFAARSGHGSPVSGGFRHRFLALAIALASLPALALTLSPAPALARPLLLSDLPPDVRMLPAAQANLPGPAFHQSGVASWYGASQAGRRMADGVPFNPRALTAAHASLPLGTILRVVRPSTGASVVVTITDRIGTDRRVIDLSRAAAARLGMVRRGLARVDMVSLGGVAPLPALHRPPPHPIRHAARHAAAHPIRHVPAPHPRILARRAPHWPSSQKLMRVASLLPDRTISQTYRAR